MAPDNPTTWMDVIKAWQPLIASGIAILAAIGAGFVAWRNVTRSIDHAAQLERRRRSKKLSSLRATLPHALSAVSHYAETCDNALSHLHQQCDPSILPKKGYAIPDLPKLPDDAITQFAEFMEYADELDVGVIEEMIRRMQIHQSRMRALIEYLESDDTETLYFASNLASFMIFGASIYAGAALGYEYARKKVDKLPPDVSWENVKQALRNLRRGDDRGLEGALEAVARVEASGRRPD